MSPKEQCNHDVLLKGLPVGNLKARNVDVFRTPVRRLHKPRDLYFSVVRGLLLWLASSCCNKIIMNAAPARFPGTDN